MAMWEITFISLTIRAKIENFASLSLEELPVIL